MSASIPCRRGCRSRPDRRSIPASLGHRVPPWSGSEPASVFCTWPVRYTARMLFSAVPSAPPAAGTDIAPLAHQATAGSFMPGTFARRGTADKAAWTFPRRQREPLGESWLTERTERPTKRICRHADVIIKVYFAETA